MAEKYELTIPQNNIWLVENFYHDKTINIISGTFTIKTGFVLETAKQTVNKFVELNDATRLKFVIENNRILQYVADYEPFEVRSYDISHMSLEEISILKEQLIHEPLDISVNPFNFILLDRKDGYGEFLLKCHHLICDAWSVSKMGTALATIYECLTKGEIDLEAQPSYVDYIKEEKEYISSDKYEKDKIFWENYLSNLGETTFLKEKDSLSTKAKRFHRVLSKDFSDKINSFCKENRLSIYSVFLSALAIYVYRVTENNDIIIGTPILNRSNFKQKQMQGMFVSTIPVRFQFNENINFIDVCIKTALDSMQIFKHQKFPYKEIVKASKLKNNSGENLFNLAFSYQNARAQIDLEKYSIDWIFNGQTQEELEFHVLDLNDSGMLEFDIDYLIDVFEENEISYLSDRILTIIQDGIEHNANIEDIKIMPDWERQKIVNIFNHTATHYESEQTVIEIFRKSVSTHPDAPALIFRNNSMSYQELDQKSNAIAHYLKNQGIDYGDRVAVILDKSFDLLTSILGILKVGACYVPIDDNYNIERKKYILEESKVKLCLCDKWQDFNQSQVIVKNISSDNVSSFSISSQITATSPVCILYTSGTTGKPKGVEIINRNIIKLVRNINYMDFPKDARILQVASIVFDLSIFEFWASLLNGKTLCLLTKDELLNFTYLKNYIDVNNINIMCITSVLFNQIVTNHIEVFENMKQILTGGDKISVEHVKKLKATYPHIKIYNSYGPTECTSFCTMYEIKDIENLRNIPIGKPISNSACYVLDSKNRLLPLYCVGELAIGGDGVSNGYINDAIKTNQHFIDNAFDHYFIGKKLYKTGDLVKLLDDGNIDFVGRKDNQIKIRGYRVELDEIKEVVLKYEGIENCAIVLNEDAKNKSNKQILLYFVANKQINTKLLLDYLKTHLQSYMVPSGMMQIERIPLNANYKLDKSKLPEISITASREFVKLSTVLQKELYNIVFNILKQDFSIEDNLFSIGFDSLSAIELSNAIDKKFHVLLSTKDILENNTIIALEDFIEKYTYSSGSSKMMKQSITSGEKSVYLEWLKNPANTLYNAPFELKFSKNTDVFKLKQCILDTIYNHPNMNAEFKLIDDVITKKISNVSYDIEIANVSSKEYENICKNFVQPFDLSHFPLFKIKIYCLEDSINVLLDIHHIIFDGSSFVIFLKEITDRYSGVAVSNRKNEHFEQVIDTDKFEKAKQYFLDTFDGDLPVNDLPYDRPRPKDMSFSGNSIQLTISKEKTHRIEAYIKNNSITLNSLFQSAFAILLAKYVYHEDIIFGMAVSGRENKELENEIGMYVKTVPFRTQINWQTPVLDYIQSTFKNIITTIDYSIYPYDNLVKDLKLARTGNRNLLFDVMFVCQSMHLPDFCVENEAVSFAPVHRTTSKFDLTCEVIPTSDNIQINLEYATDLFYENTILHLGKHYLNIIEQITSGTVEMLSDIDMILPEEREIILHSFNDNKTDFPKLTVHELFEKQVELHPDKKAVVFENQSLTYRELNEKANRLARYFIQNGLEKHDIVSIMIDKSIDYMPVCLAVLKCGAAYTPIIRDLPDERAKYMMENANSKLIVTTNQFYKKISDIKTLFVDDESLYSHYDASNLNLDYSIDDMLHIIYTSGSTGLPKGNMIKHRGMVRLLLNTNYVDYTCDDTMVTSASLTFDISGFELWAAMLYGMTLHMMTKEHIMDIHYYSNYLSENKITTTFLATPIFHLMVEENVDMFANMKSIYVGGETLLPKYTNMLFSAYPNVKVYNAYGPAEITVICCSQLIDRLYESSEDIPLGKIVSNNTVYVLDKCQKLCPINVPGELYVMGDGLGLGYINRDDLTKEKFGYIPQSTQLSYRSGDLTKWNSKGEIRFMTRIDTQVKIRGQRIELSEIQNKILELKQVKEAVLVVKEYKENKYIIGYYTVSTPISTDEINHYIEKYLPSYMIPYKLIQLNKMPYNQNGKIDRNKLPNINFLENEATLLPENENEAIILDAFKKVLKNDTLYMNSDFFEVGGDSLIASKLVVELQSKNIQVSYADIFKYKTPSEIYQYVFLKVPYESAVEDLKDYDFSAIHHLLNENLYSGDQVHVTQHIGNVLLTGVTGFLGVHILRELVDNPKVDRIFCLIREKDNLNTEVRFKKQLNFFFSKNIVEKILTKAEVVNGDITNNHLFITPFHEKIDVVINSAAYVKHYGDYEQFYRVNVLGVENIIRYCTQNHIRLIQMSTLSVSGNILEAGQTLQVDMDKNTPFNESNLYIKQNIENVYVNTKFIAEVKIFEAILHSELKANIVRLGNLTGRLSDGKFQPNVEDNAFSNRIKSLTLLKAMSSEMEKKYIEMTPIDVVSCAINKILEIENSNIVYHLFNHNHIPMPDLIRMLGSFGCNITVLDKVEFVDLIRHCLKDETLLSRIQGIIPDIAEDGSLEYNDTVIIQSDISQAILKQVGFEWPVLGEKYLQKYLQYLNNINFINLTEENNE